MIFDFLFSNFSCSAFRTPFIPRLQWYGKLNHSWLSRNPGAARSTLLILTNRARPKLPSRTLALGFALGGRPLRGPLLFLCFLLILFLPRTPAALFSRSCAGCSRPFLSPAWNWFIISSANAHISRSTLSSGCFCIMGFARRIATAVRGIGPGRLSRGLLPRAIRCSMKCTRFSFRHAGPRPGIPCLIRRPPFARLWCFSFSTAGFCVAAPISVLLVLAQRTASEGGPYKETGLRARTFLFSIF
jgi:hypothetical protein